MREVTTKKLRRSAADLRGVLGGPGLSAQEVDWIADRIDALTAMVERLADECEGWVGYVTESVHCEAYKQAMIPVTEARARIGEDAK